MKKKYREITVDGVKYTWRITNNNDGDDSNFLKVWLDKKPVFEDKIDTNVASPGVVAEVIRNIGKPKMNLYFVNETDFIAAEDGEKAVRHYCKQTGNSFSDLEADFEEISPEDWDAELWFYETEGDVFSGRKTLAELMGEIVGDKAVIIGSLEV